MSLCSSSSYACAAVVAFFNFWAVTAFASSLGNQTLLEWHYPVDSHGFAVTFTVDPSAATVTLNITKTNYNIPHWFGLVFNDAMIPADAVVYTTGKHSAQLSEEPDLYAYRLAGRRLSGVNYRSESEDWIPINHTLADDRIELVFYQELSKTAWSVNTKHITFRIAQKADAIELSSHSYRSDTIQLDLGSDSDSVKLRAGDEQYIETLQSVHGILMVAAFTVFASLGIMSSAFRHLLFSKQRIASGVWLQFHRSIQLLVIFLALIAFVIAIVFTSKLHGSGLAFHGAHGRCGLVIIAVLVTQPINAFFRPHCHSPQNDESATKSLMRRVWEYAHKFIGYSLWIVAQINIYLGIVCLSTSRMAYTHVSFSLCIAVAFIVIIVHSVLKKSKENRIEDRISASDINSDESIIQLL